MGRVLVFNALSFLGFHLVDKLLNEGEEVLGVDVIDSERKEEMFLSIGRNSSFELQRKWDEKEDLQAIVGCFYDCTTYVDAFKTEYTRAPHLLLTSEKTTVLDDAIKQVVLPIVYGPWRAGGLAELKNSEKETYWYIDDAIAYVYKHYQQLVSQRDESISYVQRTPYEEGIQKLKAHMEKLHWLYQ